MTSSPTYPDFDPSVHQNARTELSQRSRDVLAAVQAACDSGGHTLATDQQLGERAGFSSNIVRKVLTELEAAGYLTRQKRRGRRKITLTPLATAAGLGVER